MGSLVRYLYWSGRVYKDNWSPHVHIQLHTLVNEFHVPKQTAQCACVDILLASSNLNVLYTSLYCNLFIGSSLHEHLVKSIEHHHSCPPHPTPSFPHGPPPSSQQLSTSIHSSKFLLYSKHVVDVSWIGRCAGGMVLMGDIDPNVNEVFVVGGLLVVLMFWCRLWHW